MLKVIFGEGGCTIEGPGRVALALEMMHWNHTMTQEEQITLLLEKGVIVE